MMDRALKERIIGAVVLVIFAVLVVPVFLDGPPGEGEVVSEPVLLPGQDAQKTQTVVLNSDRTQPVPVANAPAETAQPAVVVETPKPETQPTPEPSPAREAPAPATNAATEPAKQAEPAASATGMWAVQLGSFSNKENAEKLAADLRKQGYAAFLSQLDTPGGQLHRVRIGPQKDRESAEAMAARLAKVGHKGQVVPHP